VDQPRKVLIFHASAGHGHEKAAKAIFEAFRESYPSESVELCDALKIIPPLVARFYKWNYYFQIKRAPWMWGGFYFTFDQGWLYGFTKLLRRFINGALGGPLEKFIETQNPAVIVSTHFLPVEVANFLKTKSRVRSKIVVAVTDYLPHHVWLGSEVDFYVVAAEDTKKGLIERGVASEKIKVLGIPVEKKFLLPLSKLELCKKLSLRQNLFTVLITSGGAGYGETHKIVEGILSLKKPIQVIVVCGTNKALHAHMTKTYEGRPLIKIFGFVANMDELMEVSDLVMGKGGGITVTESLVKGRPVMVFKPVPGQESRNAFFVEEHHVGFATNSMKEAVAKVSDFYDNPEKLDQMRKNSKLVVKPQASLEIAELAHRL